MPVQWSGTVNFAQQSWLLTTIDELPGGCQELGMLPETSQPSENLAHMYLCLPDGAFPFQLDDTLTISQALGLNTLSIRNQNMTELLVLSRVNNLDGAGLDGELLVEDCNGIRTDCGALVFPVAANIDGVGEVLTGSSTALPKVGNLDRTLFIGNAELVRGAPTSCGPDIKAQTISADLVVVYTAENSQ